MTNAILECAPNNFKIPSCEELRGRILLDELELIRRHVMAVKRSWVTTGCSILLDGWTDHGKGRSLINFLVDSPGGPIFLRSADVSGFDKDVNAMSSLLDGVIEEVGVGNVIQVITYSTSACMDALGKRLTAKHRSMFWTVCASHCIGLMLEKIEALALTKKILDRAKIITRFIYSHAMVLRLMRKNCGVRDVVCPSKIKSAASFLTLANIVSESKNLKSIFESFAWNTSTWASTSAGKMVADLVGESSFWTEAGMVLKATIPLVRVLKLLNGEDGKPQVGYIYETMDQAKEAIKMEFGNKKGKYLPFWKIIDEIWDNHLHSPLHSAGYYFNPGFFYSSDFLSDAEVASGLLCCIVRMVEDRNIQDLISLQMDEYRMAKGGFGDQSAVEQRTQIPPAEWWSRYGGQCPELQRFAIRILSQTCSGGFKYQLRRSLSEQMHTHRRNNVEQRRLSDLTFVHHNLQLQHQHHHHSSIIHRYNKDIIVRDMDAMNDWVVAPDQHTCPNSSDSDWVFSDCDVVVEKDSGNPRGVVPPGFSLKQEAF
ncbi:hypothetical protein Sjap_023130 [Stephania japonica]|uniref:DUF659 domain-containing protein n=1 Tax=Stephania japonica TaxID=461633 RepID=A0AAP0HQI6_9MAGN